MRDTILSTIWQPPLGPLSAGQRPDRSLLPTHFGHAYERLAPPPKSVGTADTEKREDWLDRCQEIAIVADYARYFDLWKASFEPGESATETVTAASRLLVGHGNPSGADVGLTVHHTWGVPMIPGSALKGVLAHYADAVYGGQEPPEDSRRKWRGPTIGRDGRVALEDQPGEYYAALFGSPTVTGDDKAARAGLVTFHDALYVPGSIKDRSVKDDTPFARDVLTVHQKPYYDNSGKPDKDGKEHPPTDWDDPNPVGFITVRPKARFLLTLTGPNDWTALAMRLLREALTTWGAGGKTSAGYGRLE